MDEREILPKPDDPKVTRIVRYESGSGEVIEIIEVPDPHKAAEYKVPTNDELRPKPSRRFEGKTAIRASGRSSWQGWHRASVHGIIVTRDTTRAK